MRVKFYFIADKYKEGISIDLELPFAPNRFDLVWFDSLITDEQHAELTSQSTSCEGADGIVSMVSWGVDDKGVYCGCHIDCDSNSPLYDQAGYFK